MGWGGDAVGGGRRDRLHAVLLHGMVMGTNHDSRKNPPVLRFAEELLIFLLDKQSGQLTPVSDSVLYYALAGTVLMDLALEDRIDTDLERLVLIDSTPLNDDLLDPALAVIAAETGGHDTAHWIERLATPEMAGNVQDNAINRLIERGILEQDSGGFLSLTRLVGRARRYPMVDGRAGREVEGRIMGILFADDVPHPRDAMLIAVVDASGIFERILSPEERAEVADRIDLLRRLDLIGRTVSDAIRGLGAPDSDDGSKPGAIIPGPEERAEALAGQPVATGGLPVLGHAIGLSTDPMAFLTKQYRALGPVFRVRVPGDAITVLAGPEANAFLQRQSRLYLRSLDAMAPMVRRLRAHRALLNMDGGEHFRLRKAINRSYSHNVALEHLDVSAGVATRAISGWPEEEPFAILPALRPILAEQAARVITGSTVSARFDDLSRYVDTVIAYASRRVPKWTLRLPGVRRARAVTCRMAEEMLNAHDPRLRAGAEPNLIDALIELHRADPQFLPQNELRVGSLAPFLAGLHTTGATAAFMLYEVLRQPEIHAAMQAEADALFEGEGPSPNKLRGMDVTNRALMETLRLYPVAGLVLRDVVNTFEMAGHTIPYGEQIIIAATVPHFCEEHFPDPLRFDIDRYLPERNEHRARGVYAPFGLGAHRCIGSRFAEVQIALTIATLLHLAQVTLHSPRGKLKPKYDPALTPGKALRIKVARRHRS